MRFLERTAERLQLENDNLKAEITEVRIDLAYRDQKYQELLTDFEMTEDFRCQVEQENTLLKAQVTNLTNLLEEALDNLEEAVNEVDRLEAVNYDLKCDLAEARTDLAAAQNELRKLSKCHLNSLYGSSVYGSSVYAGNMIALTHILQSLKADGIIPQQTEVTI